MNIAARGYVNADLLWSPEQLAERLGKPGLTVIDTRRAEDYANGHIAGAGHFDPYFCNCDDTDPAPLRSFTRMWAEMLAWRGANTDDTIVLYGAFSDNCAARAWWFVEYLGHDDVHVLDGGVKAWTAAGLPLVQGATPPKPGKFAWTQAMDTVGSYQTVLDAIDNPDWVILDNRGPGEWDGSEDRAKKNGHVPSARHLNWIELYDPETGCYKDAAALKALFEARGATPDKNVVCYCNTGFRSAHSYLALRLLGYPSIRNYVGSWQEWGIRDGTPVIRPGE